MYGTTYFRRVVSTCSVQYSKKGGSKKLLEFLANMPRTSTDILEAQRQRINVAKKGENYPVSTIYLQVLGSGARGVPNTLYLFTDQKRYLFNCGESTQRLAHEHKVRLSRLEHIFITGKSWKNIGGLPGASLTLQDVGVPSITLHGPEGLDELYNATKRFVIMKEMNVQMAKCNPNEDFVDNVMSVKYVLLGPDEDVLDPQPLVKKAKKDDKPTEKEFEEFIHDDTDYYKTPNKPETNKNKSPKHNSRSPDFRDPIRAKNEKVLLNLQKKSNYTVAYICTFKKRYGQLDLKKCVERGVKPGPLLGKLKMGEDVLLDDGTLVLAKDVKTPDDPGPVFIVMEVPDISYLKESEFSAHFDNGFNRPENIPQLVVHMTPPDVFHHPTYTAFMALFGPKTRHLVLNAQNCCLGSEAVHRTQNKLHLLDADMFPLLRDLSVPAVWRAHPPAATTDSPAKLKGLEELKNKIALAQFQTIINMEGSGKGDAGASSDRQLDVIAGRTLTTFHLRPRRELDRSLEPKLQIEEYIREAMAEDGFPASLDKFKKIVERVRYAKNASQTEYPKVVFLGTGSCIPSKTRNTSAIAIQIDETRSMLLDCGEGTFGQLVRFFGPKRVNTFLRTLKAIYVSHLHADHHLGLIGLLQERRRALNEASSPSVADDALHLLAPGQIVSWLATYDAHFERIRGEFTLVPNQSLLAGPQHEAPGVSSAVLASIGVQSVRTCYVNHCPNAFGLALDVDGRHSITYSGDTIPCDALVELGKDCTLLIHEATMEDELADEARHKMHSTTSQAIAVGRRMNAKYTVLTHFSQRYARLPRLNAHILNDNTSVGIAFDNMQITMNDLDLLPHMYAPLQLMFAEHCVDMEVRAAQRAAKRARRTAAAAAPPAHSHDNIQTEARSTPVPPTNKPMYRDSNASRLRNEIRRMVGHDPVKRGCRSKSCSSTTTKSASSVTPRSNNSENTSPERPIDVKTPQTASNTSKLGQESLERSTAVANGHVIDTRSRTLSYASAAPSNDKVCDGKTTNKKTELINATSKESSSGYGKPLVTPVNKKLLIRRCTNETEKLSSNVITANKRRSSVKTLKAENRPSSASVTSNKREVSKTKIPANTHGQSAHTAHKPRWSPSSPSSDTRSRKSGALSNHGTSYPQRINLSPRRTSSADREPDDSKSMTSTHCSQYDRKVKSWNTDSISSQRKSPRSQTPNGMRAHPFNIRATVNKVTENQDRLSDKTKKNTTVKEVNRPIVNNSANSKLINHSNKSFKPQLEDIKSSYLLLNKKPIDKNTNEPVENDKKLKQNKTYLYESIRRAQLHEIKQKYKSKEFWNNSKYDKIEGLNWISWK